MPLIKSVDIIRTLNENEEFAAFPNLECWKKEEDGYNIYIFSIQIKDEQKLVEIKEDLRDYLAIYFQSQTLEKDVERWNIYQAYFIEQVISINEKMKIEQDKFSTRKLIFDNLGKELNDEEITNTIFSEIFKFSPRTSKPAATSLLDELNDSEKLILSNIEHAKGDINELLKRLGNE